MARDSSLVVHAAEYGLARVVAAAITSFDAELNLRSAAVFGRWLHAIDRRHRDRARRHLHLAFPEKPAPEIHALAEQSLQRLVQLAIEVLHTPRLITTDTWPRCLHLTRMGPAIELLNANQPVLLITGHLGNWEVLGLLLSQLGYDIHAIARPLDNHFLNDWLLGLRQRRGLRIITKWNATDRMIEVLDRGGALGFIADQNAGDKGLFVPFFGRLASTYKSIGLLAMTRHVPIVCGYARRVGPGYRFELGVEDIIHPDDWQDREDPLFYITARYMRAIEMMVRQSPADYLWMHRRWKSRPGYEREGKPMPASLRRHLLSLPWLDEAAVDQLARPVEPS